jgi:hypothetical protein
MNRRRLLQGAGVSAMFADQTLFYLLKYPSRQEATLRWKVFEQDPEWVEVRKTSEANGKLVERVESTFLKLGDFSPSI